jgi:hypothetical protein
MISSGPVGKERIQLAMHAERKSPARKGDEAFETADRLRKKTRPSAQYNANGLASPGY